MSTRLLLLLLVLIPAWGQTNRTFKSFYQDGNTAFEAGNFKDAIVSFKEALRLESKAQRYKVEGTFFANYLPRYSLALAFEKIDILEAERWARESETASESSIMKERDKARATYYADIERIYLAAKTHVAKLDSDYNLKLQNARTLLTQKKFDAAKAAFSELQRSNPSKPEGAIGVNQVDAEKSNYLRQLELDFKEAVLTKNYNRAEEKISLIASVDKEYALLPSLRTNLANAREAATPVPEAHETSLVKTDTKPPVTKEAELPKETTQQVSTTPNTTTKPKASSETSQDILKAELKEALLATLRPYRRGDITTALQELKKIDSPLAESSGSYHWLKGVYLVTLLETEEHPESHLQQEAEEAMTKTSVLIAGFDPDPRLYPEFVRDFYFKHKDQGQN